MNFSIAEFRGAVPLWGQFAGLCLDAVLWFVFAVNVPVTTTRLTAPSATDFQIVLGTGEVMHRRVRVTVPLSCVAMIAQILENQIDDETRRRSGERMIKHALIGRMTDATWVTFISAGVIFFSCSAFPISASSVLRSPPSQI